MKRKRCKSSWYWFKEGLFAWVNLLNDLKHSHTFMTNYQPPLNCTQVHRNKIQTNIWDIFDLKASISPILLLTPKSSFLAVSMWFKWKRLKAILTIEWFTFNTDDILKGYNNLLGLSHSSRPATHWAGISIENSSPPSLDSKYHDKKCFQCTDNKILVLLYILLNKSAFGLTIQIT